MKKGTERANNDLIKTLNIKEKDSKKRPYSFADKSIVNIQLEIAKIIMRDAYEVQMQHPEANFTDIVNELTLNWRENVRNFVFALIIKKG